MISMTINTIKISFMHNVITNIIIYQYNCNMLDIIVHNTSMQCHISIYLSYIHDMGGWLSPCTAITTYNTTSLGNKAIWARRTKCHSPPYPYYYGNKKYTCGLYLGTLLYCMVIWKMSNYYF